MIEQLDLQYVEDFEIQENTFYTGYVDKRGRKCAYGIQTWPDKTKYEDKDVPFALCDFSPSQSIASESGIVRHSSVSIVHSAMTFSVHSFV